MKDQKAVIHCEHCCFAGEAGESGGFDVRVPLTDMTSGDRYIALLSCEVDTQEHRISLKQLHDTEGNTPELTTESQSHLDALLSRVAEKRICGNEDICPAAVVDVVKRSDHRARTEHVVPHASREQGSR